MRPRTISAIANTALYAWLSPVCVRCHGRGFNGGFGVPVVFCTACVGLGKRLLWLSKTDQGNALGRLLLRHMDEKTTLVAERMGRFLRHHRALPQVRRSAAERELTRQLADLRSTEAQED